MSQSQSVPVALRPSLIVSYSHVAGKEWDQDTPVLCAILTLNLILGLEHNGTDHLVGLGHSGTVKQRDWDTMGLGHNGIGTHWDLDMIGAQRDWNKTRLGHSGTAAQPDRTHQSVIDVS